MTKLSKIRLENEETQMQLESTKRENQEYFAAWDKKIENTLLSMVAALALPVLTIVALNIFTIAILFELKLI